MRILPRELWPLVEGLSREQLADLAWSLTTYVSVVGDAAQERLFLTHVGKVKQVYRFTKQED